MTRGSMMLPVVNWMIVSSPASHRTGETSPNWIAATAVGHEHAEPGADVRNVVHREDQERPELREVEAHRLHHRIAGERRQQRHHGLEPQVALDLVPDLLEHVVDARAAVPIGEDGGDLPRETVLLEQEEDHVDPDRPDAPRDIGHRAGQRPQDVGEALALEALIRCQTNTARTNGSRIDLPTIIV
ncbi:MAG TPA: hypothetical protein VIL35_04325 [Vicinamibacterales bacterium]